MPDDYKYHFNKGKKLYEYKRYIDSLNEFKICLRFSNKDEELLHIYIALIYYSLKRYDEALFEFKKSLSYENRKNIGYLNFYIGKISYKLKKYEQSLTAFNICLNCYNETNIIRNYIGKIYIKMGQYDKAIEEFLLLARSEGINIDAHINMGLAYERLKNYNEAFGRYIYVFSIDKNNIKAHCGMIRLYIKNKKYELALKHIIILLKINRSSSIIIKLIKQLSKILKFFYNDISEKEKNIITNNYLIPIHLIGIKELQVIIEKYISNDQIKLMIKNMSQYTPIYSHPDDKDFSVNIQTTDRKYEAENIIGDQLRHRDKWC